MSSAAKTVRDIASLVRRGEYRAADAVLSALAKIETHNPALGAFVHIDAEGAMRAAEDIDKRVRRGEKVGALAGVPFGVKDLEDCAGMPTTYGSLFYKDAPPAQFDSTHVGRLRADDAIPLGKTATGEFGMDSATFTRAFGAARNPWNFERTPGGSSGGSAAAVAAGLTPFCVGSDGGGSIRSPAAFSGLVGFKPSHGRIPNANGGSMLSCLGPLTSTVRDVALYLDVAAGPSSRDRTSLPPALGSFEQAIDFKPPKGSRALYTPDYGFVPVEPEVRRLAEAAAAALFEVAHLTRVDLRFQPTNVYLDWIRLGADSFYIELQIAGWLPERLAELSPAPRKALEMFPHHDAREIHLSRQRMLMLEREVSELFEEVEYLISPTVACLPFAADGLPPEVIDGRDASQTGAEPFGMLANVCWLPSISLPAGISKDGLPVGLQVTARRHQDAKLLALAALYEQARPWPLQAPGFSDSAAPSRQTP